jgi:PAN domain
MKLTALVLLSALAFPQAADAETRYGSFLHEERMPKSLFLTGEIRQGDSFELRKALRDHEIRIVIMGSAGGNLYEGLQMGSILWDKGISTYVPVGVNCESSCANMFFGGINRKVDGQLGVHQFYSSDRDKNAPLGATEATAQYTMADVIGIMNAFNTPAFVYEKMLGTTEMYYFSEEEKFKLALNSDETEFLDLQALNAAFISDNPEVIERPQSSPDPEIAEALAPVDPTPSLPTAPPPTPMKPERYKGIDFFGSDIHPKGIRGISLEKCEQICTEDSSCAAWSYVHATSWCWPKSGVDNISLGDGITSGIVDGTRFDMSIFDRPFIEMTAADLPGNDILPRGMSNTTLDECRSACQASSSCRAFTWVGKKNLCFPKYAASKSKAFVGAISGVKR